MKIKTWEKYYWGIITALITVSLIGIITTEGDIKVTVGGKESFVSKGKATMYILLFYLGLGLIIWLIVRFFANSGDDKRER